MTTIVDTHVHYEPADPMSPQRKWPAPPVVVNATPPAARVGYEHMLGDLDALGIGQAVQITPTWMNHDNRYSVAGATFAPDRFVVFGQFDPRGGHVDHRLLLYLAQPGMRGVRLNLRPPLDEWLENGILDNLLMQAQLHHVPVAVYAPGAYPAVANVARRWPQLRIAVDHCGMPFGRGSAALDDVDAMSALFDLPNVIFKVSGLPEASGESYPFPTAQDLLKRLNDAVGSARLMWGSNYPRYLADGCGYADRLNYIVSECAFFSADDKERVLGGTALEFLAADQ